MVKRKWWLFLKDILDSMDRAVDYALGMNRETFFKDTKTYDAVVRNLEIIREANKHLTEKVKHLYPDVNWKGISRLDKVGSQKYFEIDPDEVWQDIQYRIPELRPEVEKILMEQKGSSGEIEI
jgi:uncharacterized protein with HEPN domain